MRDASDARRRAWQTRRERYGERGHASQYRQVTLCPHCEQLRAENETLRQRVAETVTRETLEEGR